MAGTGRVITTSELESMLFYTVRYALTQEIVSPEIVTLIERHAGHISVPMMQELSMEILGLLPQANIDKSEQLIWRTVAELLLRNAKKKKLKHSRGAA